MTTGFLRDLPKVELHIHLEGSIGPETLLSLFRRHANPEYTTLEQVRRLYRHGSFPEFLALFREILRALRAAEDFEPITFALLADLAAQNVRYAEVTFAPFALSHFHGLDPDRILDAIQAGAARARADHHIHMALLVDLIRNMGVENGWRTARWAARARDRGVVGINLGGDEREFPAAPFAGIYRWARDQGLRTTAHAGEGDGPESIRDCARLLRAERIGHATRAVEDPALLDELAERRIPVECCPGSNVATGIVPDLAAHPVRRFFDHGVRLSINSDDPPLFATTLTRELQQLQAVHHFTDAEIRQLARSAVEMSFLPEERKAALAPA
ncbi:MAG: adenosine deaminase [Armatimonadetes bacterium]|nr:adenosine deaminase [Armatimonadota bacterium]